MTQTKIDYSYIADFLIAHKSQVNFDYKPFQLALENDYHTFVEFLSKGDKDVNNYIMSFAAKNGHLNDIKCLIEKGADFMVGNNYTTKYISAYIHLGNIKFLIKICMNNLIRNGQLKT